MSEEEKIIPVRLSGESLIRYWKEVAKAYIDVGRKYHKQMEETPRNTCATLREYYECKEHECYALAERLNRCCSDLEESLPLIKSEVDHGG